MYIEFIIIFVLLGILLALMIAAIVMIRKINKKINNIMTTRAYPSSQTMSSHNVVFCKNCATEYDAMQRRCPNCGTPR